LFGHPGLWTDYLTTKTEERCIAKATNSKYFTQLLAPKVILLFEFNGLPVIDHLIKAL